MYWTISSIAQYGVYTITLTGYLPTVPYSPDPGWTSYETYLHRNCDVSGGTSPVSTTFTLTV